MINAAIVGLGRWGRRLVDSVQQEGASLGTKIHFTQAVVQTPDKSLAYARGQGLVLHDALERVLQDDAVDVVVLATPHGLHAEQMIVAASAGKHVFVEKPLALALADAERAVQAMQANRLTFAVGHNRRFLPALAAIRHLLAVEGIGRIVHVEGNFSNDSGLGYTADMWRASEGGPTSAMTAMGIHTIDFVTHLCGPVRRVTALATRQAMRVAVDDTVSVVMQFESGASGFISTLLNTPRQWRIQIFGTRGWIHMRSETVMDVCDAHGQVTTTIFEEVDTLRLELEAFADAIVGVGSFPVSTAEAVHATAILEAVLLSAGGGGAPVDVRPSALAPRLS